MNKDDLTVLPESDPVSILRYRDGLYAVDLLTAAICEFDFFTTNADKPGTLEEVCERFGFAARPADVMLTLFVANAYLEIGADGIYRNTKMANEHLVAGSPWFMGPYYASLQDRPVVADFVKVLKSGKPAVWGAFEDQEDDWHEAMHDEGFAQSFTAMNCRGLYLGKKLADALAEELQGRERVLDIGGGSGIYACCLVANQPGLKARVMEQAPIDQIARDQIEQCELGESIDVVTGDMFDRGEWPDNCDVHLFSNVMHDWDEPEVRKLLEHSYQALKAGGLVVVHETFLNAGKTGPLPVAEYSCILMHSTQGRCYSTAEMKQYLEQAGFEAVRSFETAGDRGVVLAQKA
ncbi:MAG: methyltransferase domain-containing protein [Verrucomicrobia bacterium]|nr:methyltransferase domain-containing protein [Verrucomicrobiota bacterium]